MRVEIMKTVREQEKIYYKELMRETFERFSKITVFEIKQGIEKYFTDKMWGYTPSTFIDVSIKLIESDILNGNMLLEYLEENGVKVECLELTTNILDENQFVVSYKQPYVLPKEKFVLLHIDLNQFLLND